MSSLPNRIAFVDVETTGGRVYADRIIEIGIICVENNQVVREYAQLIDPGCAISSMITNITGITNAMVENQPSFRQVADKIERMIDGYTFVAHNVRFDYSFIKNEFARENIKFSPKHFCTVKLARQLYPTLPHHDLASIIRHFGFLPDKRHRAYDDAKVLWDFYRLIQRSFDQNQLLSAINAIIKKPTIPVNLAPEMVTSLPQSPGVYIFYGQEDIPLYVGKSVNIKARVLSHFSADYASQTEMKIAQQTSRIESIKTCGELGALLKESYLIKSLSPLFNRRLRRCRQFICLEQSLNAQGYQTVSFRTYDEIAAKTLPSIFGLYKSKSHANKHLINLAEKYGLCQKLLGIEKNNGSCFAYQLGKCRGACIGQEKAALYNLRLLTAFTETRIRPWPYKGPILLMEQDKFESRYDVFVIDQWCLIDQFSVNEDVQDTEYELSACLERLALNAPSPHDIFFDADAYAIIENFLRHPNNMHTIYDLSFNKRLPQLQSKRLQFGVN